LGNLGGGPFHFIAGEVVFDVVRKSMLCLTLISSGFLEEVENGILPFASGLCDLGLLTEPVNLLNDIREFFAQFDTDWAGSFHTGLSSSYFSTVREWPLLRESAYCRIFWDPHRLKLVMWVCPRSLPPKLDRWIEFPAGPYSRLSAKMARDWPVFAGYRVACHDTVNTG
jgi:hypothetical protein